MLLTTPTLTPRQPLVPLELYEQTWIELKPILKEYLHFHFTKRPQGCPFDKIERKCADLIEIIANQIQQKTRNWVMIENEIRKAANWVSQCHMQNLRALL